MKLERKKLNGLTMDEHHESFKERELEAGNSKMYLDQELKKIEKIDYKIDWYERTLKALEIDKQRSLLGTMELFDTAMVASHTLQNGYKILQDNKYSMEILDTSLFLKWMKENCEPQEVLDFFSDSLKVAALKDFCSTQINKMRANGLIGDEVKIDGIEIKDSSFRRLTTKRIKL